MAAIRALVISNRVARFFTALAVLMASQSLVAAAGIDNEDLQGVVALVGMRNLALEMTDACIEVGETANGDSAMNRFRSTWNGRLRSLDERLDRIYYALPDQVRMEMELAVRARLKIRQPANQALLHASREERHSLCANLANRFMPYATDPEALLSGTQAKTTVGRILAIDDGQIRETADWLRRNYRTPEAFTEAGK